MRKRTLSIILAAASLVAVVGLAAMAGVTAAAAGDSPYTLRGQVQPYPATAGLTAGPYTLRAEANSLRLDLPASGAPYTLYLPLVQR